MGNHLIRKQVLDLKVSKRLDAFQVQHKARHFYYSKIIPALEKIFDELCGEEETIQLNTLILDMGELDEKNIEKLIWTDKSYGLLKTQISKQLLITPTGKSAVRISQKENAARQWLFYMQRGYLNWNTIDTNEKWYQTVIEVLATNFVLVAQLRKHLKEEKNIAERIVFDHPVSFLVNLLKVITTKKITHIEDTVEKLVTILNAWHKEIRSRAKNSKEIQQSLWVTILRIAARETIKNGTEEMFRETIIRESLAPVVPTSAFNQLVEKIESTDAVIKKILNEKKGNRIKEIEENKKLAEDWKEEAAIDTDGIYIQHTGLVLLHPFLPAFFRRLGLLEANQFINNDSRQKAVWLLHYLATGNTEALEYEIALPKILCGWPLEKVIAPVEIAVNEREEADNLLLSVIEKWDKLKNTSITALRENFLQRNGKIVTKNNTVFVQVESSTLDMLLDFLPWNLSIIKFPWKKELIRVEWR